jgi:NADH-quinone oxidoreductase subunit L
MLFEHFQHNPGQLYVIATLLPILSFLLIFLSFGIRSVLRRYHDTEGTGEALYKLFGGERGGKVPAYVATGAIALAFVCSLAGFILYRTGFAHHEEGVKELRDEVSKLHQKLEQPNLDAKEKAKLKAEHNLAEKRLENQEEEWVERWSGRFDWLTVSPSGLTDAKRATTLQLGYNIDGLSAIMFLMVTFIAMLIHIYSIGYMGDELAETVEDHQVHTEHGHLHRRGRFGRFFSYLSLFCFSMLNLVLADNLFQVFVSWELVGICSYLLIGFYYERQTAANAANKAFITNRIGDAGFILGLLILWTYVGTFNFNEIFSRIRSPEEDSHGRLALASQIVRGRPDPASPSTETQRLTIVRSTDSSGSAVVLFPRDMSGHFHGVTEDESKTVYKDPKPRQYGTMPYWLLVAAGLGIFLGCVGKSAQFPLQVWLPDAMEGPTPVSALIHAATMVAAGVYLVGRCYPLFTSEALLVIAYTGGITLFVAATIAIVMTDIKKVLAYSTVSQLGYMMLALGVGGWIAGLFHLLTHACFKALLFLGSGSVIYGCHHEQDMSKMGGLYPRMKITALTMLAGVLAIAGFPLFTGWYSKDSIIAQAYGFVAIHREHLLLFLLPLVTAGITTFYMFRMWFLTFTGEPRDHHVYEHAHESPHLMTVPLILLAILSIAGAWGWPIWDAQASWVEGHLHHAQPSAVVADFGLVLETEETREPITINQHAHANHHLAGNLALFMVALGVLFAVLLYRSRVLDPAEAQEQAPRVHAFLTHKWYFDELYSAMLVRPALAVSGWFRWFDTVVIDGLINGLGRLTVRVSDWDGIFDRNIIDGLVNVLGNTIYAVGGSLRRVQTGFLRSYVLFLALAAVGIFAVLSYFVALAAAG